LLRGNICAISSPQRKAAKRQAAIRRLIRNRSDLAGFAEKPNTQSRSKVMDCLEDSPKREGMKSSLPSGGRGQAMPPLRSSPPTRLRQATTIPSLRDSPGTPCAAREQGVPKPRSDLNAASKYRRMLAICICCHRTQLGIRSSPQSQRGQR